ncbi:MAG TPA: carbamoyltransferase HypF [Jiangellaceae bacterium]|nr:carbamoyltransferase HypF [Jiangellaceae bacterium]
MRRLEVHGSVQGVGFRPYVVRLATTLGLDGWVQNAGGHVVIEAAGPPEALAELARRLPAEAPPQAAVSSVVVAEVAGSDDPHNPGNGFRVVESVSRGGARDVPPDLATCADCLTELFDPSDRRYRYPFVNCTNCGPRATVIAELPYDRCRTTMAPFELCDQCAAEYRDPTDRRFHAEPTACPACGPRLAWMPSPTHRPDAAGNQALAAAVAAVEAGGIVAVKGLGGYQLVCDATRTETVARLRERKGRPAKPFAVLVRDLVAARGLAWVTRDEERLLTSVARPIVLVTARPGTAVDPGIHPGTDQIGLFLPYTPLHHLLLHDLDRPLIATSGNRSDEPIAIDDRDAFDRLGEIADGFLTHDRQIRARYDDSVVRLVGGWPAVVRRARGYAPEAAPLPHRLPRPVLAVGAQLKHTFTVAEHDRAVISPHIGDLSDHDTFTAFEQTLAHLSRLVAIEPEVVVHDRHPAYLSTHYAHRYPAGRRMAVQHHHAHVASCAAEHGITEPFLGVAYDGLGWGDDGTLWGGELLVADLAGYRRVGRFGTAPLPGGEAAIRRPARMALGYLFGGERLGGPDFDPALVQRFASRLPEHEVEVVRRMVDRGVNSPPASSAGRLFDAVASILGVRDDATYEGEAAIALEATAARAAALDTGSVVELPWRLARSDGLWVYDPRPTLATILAAVAAGEPVPGLAAAFHSTVVAATVALCLEAGAETKLRTVCLSGGVFQNQLLTSGLARALREEGYFVYHNQRVPTNDGGISYGQAAVAAARMAGG